MNILDELAAIGAIKSNAAPAVPPSMPAVEDVEPETEPVAVAPEAEPLPAVEPAEEQIQAEAEEISRGRPPAAIALQKLKAALHKARLASAELDDAIADVEDLLKSEED